MAGPTSPGTEGPTFAPPSLPPGWIAQWDGSTQKYYYVQLATGVSQWEIPTQAAKTGTTPGQPSEHPYGAPTPELITHPDGSQTVKHADGTMEPVMPDGSRGIDGPSGDRGLGTQAMNALLGGKSGSSPLGQLANQFLGGKPHGGSGGGGSSGIGGKLVGQLTSNLFSPSQKPEAPSNYHGGQNNNKPHASGGLAGAVMGQVAHMFGGKESSGGGNYGYSNAGTGGSYSGEAPTYNPLAPPPGGQQHSSSGHQYGQQQQHQQQQQQHGQQQHGQQQQYQQQQQHGGYSSHQQQGSYGGGHGGHNNQQQHHQGGYNSYGGGQPQYGGHQGQGQGYGSNY